MNMYMVRSISLCGKHPANCVDWLTARRVALEGFPCGTYQAVHNHIHAVARLPRYSFGGPTRGAARLKGTRLRNDIVWVSGAFLQRVLILPRRQYHSQVTVRF